MPPEPDKSGAPRMRHDAELHPALAEARLRLREAEQALALERERAAASAELLFREVHRAQVTIEALGDGVIASDRDGIVELINPSACALIGIDASSAVGARLDDLLPLSSPGGFPADPVPDLMGMARSGVANPAQHWTLELHSRGGSVHVVELGLSGLRDEGGSADGITVVIRDTTAAARLAEELSYEASHDPLTGLWNRREFERCLADKVGDARVSGREHALCYLDLDQFKIVNDSCGHGAGDELLKQLAVTLGKRLRSADFLARIGGDEFGLILDSCPVDNARSIAENIRRAVEDFRFNWDGNTWKLGISIGVVPIHAESGSVDVVLQSADAGCYMAKESGRNAVHVHREGDVGEAKRRGEIRWVSEIQNAMDEDRFQLAFQRIEPLQGSEGQGWAEMLARLRTPDDVTHTPGAFLPAAERYGLAHVVDQWITRRCLQWLHEGSAARENVHRCSINLSGATLSKESFLYFVEEQLERYPVPAENLCFEVTETAAISNLRAAQKFFERFKERGCTFALDDFGSGVSSFGYLRTLPVDYLKIDGSFVRDMDSDKLNLEFVRSIDAIGKTMGLKTIAEFVETPRVLALLRELGVDYGQGFFMHRPAHATMTSDLPPGVHAG